MAEAADELIRSYFRRWEDPNTRYSDLTARLSPASKDRSHFACKAFKKAGLLLGIDDQEVRRRVETVASHGYRGWPVPALEPSMFGFVYVASPEGFPHLIKVGFSARVPARMADIANAVGVPMVVRSVQPGTMVDEALLHRSAAPFRVFGEWFYHPNSSRRDLPSKMGLSPSQILDSFRRAA